MYDNFIVIILIIIFVLGWYFAISKAIIHFKVLKDSEYNFFAKFFIIGLPFLFIVPKNIVNESNYNLYKKGIKYNFLLIASIAFFYITLLFL
ncbi:MAG: hypothetical protein KAG84_08170 [Bacteroidales bacterium]|nr:hypothetical protein [Bacteroidales bacterium]